MSDRPTREVVLVILAATAAVAFVIAVVGVVLIELDNPATDTTAAAGTLGGVLTAMLGIVVGYALGRRDDPR